jgi:hypothetical protein
VELDVSEADVVQALQVVAGSGDGARASDAWVAPTLDAQTVAYLRAVALQEAMKLTTTTLAQDPTPPQILGVARVFERYLRGRD